MYIGIEMKHVLKVCVLVQRITPSGAHLMNIKLHMSHNISDFVIRIKNAIRAKHSYVKIQNTKLNRSISSILYSEGFIDGISFTTSNGLVPFENTNAYASTKINLAYTNTDVQPRACKYIVLYLRYAGKRNAITEMKVMSKPSVRMYSSAKQIPKILGGLGAVILTTSKGIMSDKKARSLNIGGELLFSIW